MTRFLEPAALWLCLAAPSAFTVQRYGGWLGLSGYGAIVAGAVWARPRLPWRVSERAAFWLSVATLAGLVAIFAVGYPHANTHAPAMGSDDDDAMNVGVAALLRGEDPYRVQTYLGGFIHQLPGALLLAAPFVLVGTSAWQNLVWLAICFVVLRRELRSTFAALQWAWLVLICSPIVLQEVVTGTGHVANAIYVMLGLWWLATAERKAWPAAAWGVALSSRANFLFLVPLAFGWLARRLGWRTAAGLLTLTALVCVLPALPFYLHDREVGFAPIESAERLTRFDTLLPHAGWLISLATAALTVSLAWPPMPTLSTLWRNCALVLAAPVAAGFLIGGGLDFLTYGTFAMCFGVVAVATRHGGSHP